MSVPHPASAPDGAAATTVRPHGDGTAGELAPAGSNGADPTRRRALGAFYTPEHAVEYMLTLLRGVDEHSRILEPSGGDGAFVAQLTRTLPVAGRQVDVCDLDPAVGPALARFGVGFTCRDALLDPPSVPGGYTHVVGNPPYLSKHSDYLRANRDELRRRYSDIGAHDTYAMFTRMALDALAPGGQLVFLISDTFLTLGVHRAFRQLLLQRYTVDALTLLPRSAFKDASVGTVVLAVTNAPPAPGHAITVRDCRSAVPGDYSPAASAVPQAELAALPAAEFAVGGRHRELLALARDCDPLMSWCDGGLGIYTRANATYLAVITDAGHPRVRPSARMGTVDAGHVDGRAWRAYHKTGGARRWWAPAEHAIRWRPQDQDIYTIPATARVGEPLDGRPRPGVVLSGISTELSARLVTPGAMWESNKVFGIFPKDPAALPAEAVMALLNSALYTEVAGALNHTISLQSRDLARLPMLPLTRTERAELTSLGRSAVAAQRAGDVATLERVQLQVDRAVAEPASRVR